MELHGAKWDIGQRDGILVFLRCKLYPVLRWDVTRNVKNIWRESLGWDIRGGISEYDGNALRLQVQHTVHAWGVSFHATAPVRAGNLSFHSKNCVKRSTSL